MKKLIYTPAINLVAIAAIVLFFSCNENKIVNKTSTPLSGEYYEESWREAAEFENKITKDESLGYVPVYRLQQAGEDLKQGRFARQGARTEAMVWTERGPSSDAVGSNGNPRPPGLSTSGRVDPHCMGGYSHWWYLENK
jgi:hypothetical protein